MENNKNKYPIRKRTRLIEYDYSNNGYYFITICVDDQKQSLGVVENNEVVLNEYGKFVELNLQNLAERYDGLEIDFYIIMPNHIHVIFILYKKSNENHIRIPSIVGAFKSITTIQLHKIGLKEFKWQRSYYDRIIRNENELYNIRKYIDQNPLKWDLEKNNPANLEM
jgi:REP element-mobilizing transposase RayT